MQQVTAWRCTSEDAMASVEIDKCNYDYNILLIIHNSLDQRLAKNFCIEIHLASTGQDIHNT